MLETERITYPDIIHIYHSLNMPHDLGPDAHSLFLGLVYKASLFDFTITELSIPNSEMCLLSVLTERAMTDARSILVKYRLRGNPVVMPGLSRSNTVVDYQRGYKGQSGVYTTHFDVLLEYEIRHPVVMSGLSRSNSHPKVGFGDGITPVYADIYNKENSIVSDENDEFQWLLERFQNAAPGWCIQNDYQRQALREILEYPKEHIETVLKRGGRKGLKASALISWVEGGLRSYEKFYGKKDTPPTIQYRTPETERAGNIRSLNDMYDAFNGATIADGKFIFHKKQYERQFSSVQVGMMPYYMTMDARINKIRDYGDELDFTLPEWQAVADRLGAANDGV